MQKYRAILLTMLVFFCAILLVACKEEPAPLCADGHSFKEEVVKAPTCTEVGLAHSVCSVCNTLREVELPAKGHVGSEWTVTLPPTCTEEGIRAMFCAVCDEQLYVESLPVTSHTASGEWIVDVAPTCTTGGKRHTDACSVCGAIDVVEMLPALRHEPSEWQTVTVLTCTSAGVRQKTCTRCGEVAESETTGALGHVYGTWWADANNDLRVYRTCARANCGAIEEYVHDTAVTESGAYTQLQLSGYGLVYSSGASSSFQQQIATLASHIYGYTNVPVSASIGSNLTKIIRVQTGSDASITGHGFAIKCNNGTITIIGTTSLITQMAVDYFMRTYVTGAVITLPALAVSDGYEMIDVSHYDSIYSDALDDVGQGADETARDPDTFYGNSSETGCDYVVDLAFQSATQLISLAYADTRASVDGELLIGKTNRVQSDIALAYLKGHEYGIMMVDGRLVVAGYATAAFHKAGPILSDYLEEAKDEQGRVLLPANFCIIGEASTRWLTDEAVLPTGLPLYAAEDDGEGAFQYLYRGVGVHKDAFDAYVAALKNKGYTVLTSSDAEGSCFVTLTDADRGRMLHISFEAYAHASDNVAGSEWAATWGGDPAIRVVTAYVQEKYTKKTNDLKKPTGYNKTESVKSYESGVTNTYFYYQIKPTVLAAYRGQFAAEGYVEVLADQVSERYVMLNKTTGEWVDIFVGGGQYQYYICRRHYAPGVITLPSSDLLSPNQTYTKVTDAKIVAIDLSAVVDKGTSGSYGTGYVIMLEDGRFVIIDGGSSDGGTSGDAAFAQVDNCWSILSALYKDVYGVAPSPSNPVQIAAWIITHGHGDHIGVFWDFCQRYGGGGSKHSLGAYAKIEYLLANQADFTTLYNTGEPSMSVTSNLTKIREFVKDGFTYIRVQTGQKLYFANLEIETLFTQTNFNPQRIVTMNDTSAIQRLSFARTADGVGERVVDHKSVTAASKTTLLSTGDAYRWSGRWICAMYGTYLKSDMVTVSHHGGVGFTLEVYDMIAPRVVWWPSSASSACGMLASTSSAWHCKVDQHLVCDIDTVEYVYISDYYHITLALKADGPDFAGVYHATDESKTPIEYYEASKEKLKTSAGSGTYTAERLRLKNSAASVIKKV